MIELTKDNFQSEVIEAPEVVMVDWWGPHCGRCAEIMPYVEDLSGKYKDKIKFCSVDISNNRALAIDQKVLGIPAFLFYKNGKKIDGIAGQEIELEDIENKIKQYS
ncbi:MAG: thioredoxin family protein [Syntrophomonadaceae bacterium]|jgi:thioredoxin 1